LPGIFTLNPKPNEHLANSQGGFTAALACIVYLYCLFSHLVFSPLFPHILPTAKVGSRQPWLAFVFILLYIPFSPFFRTPLQQSRRLGLLLYFVFPLTVFNTLPTAKAGSRRLAASMASLLAIMSRCCWNVSSPMRASTTLRTLDFSSSSFRDCQCQKRPIKDGKRPIETNARLHHVEDTVLQLLIPQRLRVSKETSSEQNRPIEEHKRPTPPHTCKHDASKETYKETYSTAYLQTRREEHRCAPPHVQKHALVCHCAALRRGAPHLCHEPHDCGGLLENRITSPLTL
jgi:hypothetical protein